MKWWRRLKLWQREKGQRYLIREDFADQLNDEGNLIVCTLFGVLELDGDDEYDRATGAYDTEHNEFHFAFAGHDECCKQLQAYGVVHDREGNVIMTTQRQVDIAFFDLLLGAGRQVLIRRVREAEGQLTGLGKEIGSLLIRAVVYYKAVRKWDKAKRFFGLR